MAQYHPPIELLVEYVGGTLSPAYHLCVAAHLHFCEECRSIVAAQEHVAACLMEQAEPIPVSNGLFDRVMAKIDATMPEIGSPQIYEEPKAKLPPAVEKALGISLDQVKWKSTGSSLEFFRLPVGETKNELGLYKIRPGGQVPEHKHLGEEITVVLQGSFSDDRGLYLPGDFLYCDSDISHAPMASADEPCLSMTALSAPVQFTGPIRRLLNPFVNIYPS